MARSKSTPAPQAMAWRTDVPWQQDREPLMSVITDAEVPGLVERLRALGIKAPDPRKKGLEPALLTEETLQQLMNPQAGAVSLAVALVAQHPVGMDKDHLLFELALLLDEDRRTAELAVNALAGHGAIITRKERRADRYRVLPFLRPALAVLGASWLDALERRGGATGAGDSLALRFHVNPAHALSLMLAVVGHLSPRVKSATASTELHAKDLARVQDLLRAVVEPGAVASLIALLVRARLLRPTGTRLVLPVDVPAQLGNPAYLWRELLLQAVPGRAFPALLRLMRAAPPGFVPEATLRRTLKSLRHTEQIAGGHPFPTDGRGNEAGARAELEALRNLPLIDVGRTPEGASAMRLHPDVTRALHGNAANASGPQGLGHVGADHELHVPPDAPPDAVAMLGLFCQPVAIDRVSRFTITPETVSAAASRGVLPQQMEQALNAIASRGVPENVRRTLADYGAPRGRAVFGRGLVVSFSREEDARKAVDDPLLSALLGDELAPTVFLVDGSRERALRERMTELGLAVPDDTLAFTAPPRPHTEEDDEVDAELAFGARLSAAKEAARARALDEARDLPTDEDVPQVRATVLSALTGDQGLARRPTSAAGGSEVQPLRPRKGVMDTTARTSDVSAATLLARAHRDRTQLRLRYTPETGGGMETMTVEVVEMFERAGAAMVRVRFPLNTKAPERVLRVNRVAMVEPAAREETG
ncbi:MAG: hypothetical protein AB2A00_17735 [Myxococcota bacterium]